MSVLARQSGRDPASDRPGAHVAPGLVSADGAAITIQAVSKEFAGNHLALRDVNLIVHEHDFLCLVGASGCGKSTLLNLIAGLDKPTEGVIDHGGRKVAFMFQESTLFPWLTLEQNVALALKLRGIDRSERGPRVQELLELVRLGGRGKRRPHELSGGMRQRGALARVLAQDAEIVLMDEPFAALDAMTRDSMHDEIERIWHQLGLTVVFVTHNVREAVRLSNRTILMETVPGRVKSEFAIDLPRPRHPDDPVAAEISGQLTDELKAEVARHVS
jgi:NitT/TauT family transport system ATP-binding protein